MADFRRGIEAGAIAGFAYTFAVAVFGGILYTFFWGSVPWASFLVGFGGVEGFAYLGPGRSLQSLVWQIVEGGYAFGGTVTTLLQFMVWGIVFGTVFAALYTFLPGGGRVRKGLVLSAFLWIIALIQVVYTSPGWLSSETAMAYKYYGGIVNISSVSLALFCIMSALIIGWLTGYLWGRFRGKELNEERNGRPILLVSFILGAITWATLGAVFLWIVLSHGWASAMNVWLWDNVLRTSVVFLGLPGWVLALVAWRKTKRGESGLRWGVVGGIVMAVTGFMLLPGLLAIGGAALSRRKPNGETSTAAIQQRR